MEDKETKTDIQALTERAKAIGVLKEDGSLISFAEFKKRANIHDYGNRPCLKRIYLGAPNSGGMLSVFPDRMARNNPAALKDVYFILQQIFVEKNENYIDPYYIRIREKYSLSYGR